MAENFLPTLDFIIQNGNPVELYDKVLNCVLTKGMLSKNQNNIYFYIDHEWVISIREIHDIAFLVNSTIITI